MPLEVLIFVGTASNCFLLTFACNGYPRATTQLILKAGCELGVFISLKNLNLGLQFCYLSLLER